jgi:serine/threonine protein kinase/tetratricopeptide (TPR) repeat protein
MAERWRAGDCLVVEQLLADYPELGNQSEAVLDLIYEELSLRREYGKEVARSEILSRFPQLAAQLEILLDCHQILEMGSPPTYPAVGELVGDFHLLAELGRGGHGRVFLAAQGSLADRFVVIKFTPGFGQEHQALARLQHTHIMPLYSILEGPGVNQRALCMPYLGGATLAQLLKTVQQHPLSQCTGQHLLDALDEIQAVAALDRSSGAPPRQFLAQATYVQAICWIAACIAEALEYAHERGLVHMDVKPSNVLLTADGQPMLLDFHLAHEVIRPDGPKPRWIGGTLENMSPEQQVALADFREGRAISVGVDGRSDIYSLGLLLYEALGGRTPVPRAPASRFQQYPPQVSIGLADIIDKCLAQDPKDRYPEAKALAADLWRHLNDLPLQEVRNRSLAERWRKWRRRQPHVVALIGMTVAILLVAVAAASIALIYVGQQINQARAALTEGQEQLRNRLYHEAISTFTRGLGYLGEIPGSSGLKLELTNQLQLARGVQASQDLHLLADRFRSCYGVDSLSDRSLRELETCSRALWEKRQWIMACLGANLERTVERRLQTDLLDVAILWTDLRVGLAGIDQSQTERQGALQVLAQAEEMFGPSAVLCYHRRIHAEALGLRDLAGAAARQQAELPIRTAWEHYALGRSLLQSGKLDDASTMLQKAFELEPCGLWTNYYLGICAYRLGKYEDAVLAFTRCQMLAPELAGCLYNRALAYQGWDRPNRALRDYDRALELDATLGVAAFNRGLLHFQAKRYGEARDDFLRALENGTDPARVHYQLALVHFARNEQAVGRSSLKRCLEHNPAHKEARELYDTLQKGR